MKFISWNVNGLRACLGKGFNDFFQQSDADFFCVQETKMQPHQAELDFPGYEQYWNSAVKKGYSGTAVFTRHTPLSVRLGMGLEEHDRLIAYVLGLSHALNIAFFTALAESGEAAPRLARLSSTTFDAQLDVAGAVAEESPELYYEIQALNDYGAESLQALSGAVERLRTAVLTRDFATFRSLMEQGLAYLSGRREVVARRA